MNGELAIKVENVSKTFKLPHEKSSSVKSIAVNFWRHNKGFEIQKALEGISFEVKKGEFFGIVGRNGSGKSTLLKMLAGIYTPTHGNIQVNGKLTPFIELGVGFNPELTGRENVFLNGALLGFNRREMTAMYDDIVEFAELERFMDQRLKNYSSGMQVRLAFSIAIRANTDTLILDEVLAVGDEAFQRKCYRYFSELKQKGKTVVLVTHDMSAVQRFCDRALLLSNGIIAHIGDPDRAAMQYISLNDESYTRSLEKTVRQKIIKGKVSMKINNGIGASVKRFFEGDVLSATLSWSQKGVENVGIALVSADGKDIFSPNTLREGKDKIKNKKIGYKVKLNIAPGDYSFRAAIFGANDKIVIDRMLDGPKFTVEKREDVTPYVGIVRLDHSWQEAQ